VLKDAVFLGGACDFQDERDPELQTLEIRDANRMQACCELRFSVQRLRQGATRCLSITCWPST